METAFNISEYIIQFENKNERVVTNLRLQKLLYFIQAYSLNKLGRKCFDEKIEAWQYGPVVPEVYYKYKKHGSIGLTSNEYNSLESLVEDEKLRQVIETTLTDAAQLSTTTLVNISHQQTPWKEAVQEGFYYRNEINEETMRKVFCQE